MTRTLFEKLFATGTPTDILYWLARYIWANDHKADPAIRDACPPDMIPAPEPLAAWMQDGWPADVGQEVADRTIACTRRVDRHLDRLIEAGGIKAAHDAARLVNAVLLRMVGPPNDGGLEDIADRLETGPVVPPDEVLQPFAQFNLLDLHDLWRLAVNISQSAGLPTPRHPIGPIVRIWQNRSTPAGQARIPVIRTSGGLSFTRQSYEISDVLRTAWQESGAVSVVKLDGEPIGAVIKQHGFERGMDPEERANFRKRLRAMQPARSKRPPADKNPAPHLKLKGNRGYGSRAPLDLPVPLLAWGTTKQWAGPWVADDVAALIEVAHLGPTMRFDPGALAYLLARTESGDFRRPEKRDRQRALDAVAEVMALVAWVKRPDGLHWPVRLADISTDPDTEAVTIRPPAWARNRSKAGRFTLTAGQSAIAMQSRTFGRPNAASAVRRAVAATEYWLARSPAGRDGIAEALLPANGRAGPGRWYELSTREWLAIIGEPMDPERAVNPRMALTDAERQTASRRKTALRRAGYVVDQQGRPEGEGGDMQPRAAIDSVEFMFRGQRVFVRATERFTEGSRLVKAGQWEEIGFGEYIGRPKIFTPDE